ncbi:MAG: BrnA antitoxin family protein [Alphaproteobacteria bacterium]|nr:BrnA antitoxin family protein [Alphaproteobacteria bacterium]
MKRERKARMSDAEDRRITEAAKSDPDNPPLDEAMLSRMRPVAKAAPELASMARGPGRPRLQNPKLAIKLRLSPDVVAYFRATGKGWQTRIDETLRKAVGM